MDYSGMDMAVGKDKTVLVLVVYDHGSKTMELIPGDNLQDALKSIKKAFARVGKQASEAFQQLAKALGQSREFGALEEMQRRVERMEKAKHTMKAERDLERESIPIHDSLPQRLNPNTLTLRCQPQHSKTRLHHTTHDRKRNVRRAFMQGKACI